MAEKTAVVEITAAEIATLEDTDRRCCICLCDYEVRRLQMCTCDCDMFSDRVAVHRLATSCESCRAITRRIATASINTLPRRKHARCVVLKFVDPTFLTRRSGSVETSCPLLC